MRESILWLFQFITGFILIFILALHMIIMHLGETKEPTQWNLVLERGKDISYLIMYILFLLFAIFHGLYGLRNVLIEAISNRNTDRIINWILTLTGIFLFVYGSYVTIGTYLLKQ